MKIAILNYLSCEVIIETYNGDVDNIEDYLSEKYGLDNIEYMTGESISVEEE